MTPLERAREILKALEAMEAMEGIEDDEGDPRCADCGWRQLSGMGHHPDCFVAAAITSAHALLQQLEGQHKDADAGRDVEEMARAIAADLFTNGDGSRARRLVLELPNGRDGGGWSEAPAADRIARTLAYLRAPSPPVAVSATPQDAGEGAG